MHHYSSEKTSNNSNVVDTTAGTGSDTYLSINTGTSTEVELNTGVPVRMVCKRKNLIITNEKDDDDDNDDDNETTEDNFFQYRNNKDDEDEDDDNTTPFKKTVAMSKKCICDVKCLCVIKCICNVKCLDVVKCICGNKKCNCYKCMRKKNRIYSRKKRKYEGSRDDKLKRQRQKRQILEAAAVRTRSLLEFHQPIAHSKERLQDQNSSPGGREDRKGVGTGFTI